MCVFLLSEFIRPVSCELGKPEEGPDTAERPEHADSEGGVLAVLAVPGAPEGARLA